MSVLFKEIIPSILEKKNSNAFDEKEYVPFVVNKALSFHKDCILIANELNMRMNIDKDMQFQFLFHMVKSRKRPFQQWIKKEENQNINIISEYYDISKAKAAEYLKILTDEDINEIKEETNKGGAIKDVRNRRYGGNQTEETR